MSLVDNVQIVEHNVKTGKITKIDITEVELDRQLDSAFLEAREEKLLRNEMLESKKKIILEKLGITEEEAKLLLS